jgi:hypothetical protein
VSREGEMWAMGRGARRVDGTGMKTDRMLWYAANPMRSRDEIVRHGHEVRRRTGHASTFEGTTP